MRKRKPGNPAIEEKKAKLKKALEVIANMSPEEREAMLLRLGAVVTCEGHACSVTNTILLWHQSDTVSVVGGYRQWLAQSRQVRQGERCLYIFAPVKQRQDNDGEISTGRRFVTAAVFDISQTDPVEVEVAQA